MVENGTVEHGSNQEIIRPMDENYGKGNPNMSSFDEQKQEVVDGEGSKKGSLWRRLNAKVKLLRRKGKP